MSDLFGRLAQRALAAGGGLRPITPPIFGAPTGAPAGVAEPEAVALPGPAGGAVPGRAERRDGTPRGQVAPATDLRPRRSAVADHSPADHSTRRHETPAPGDPIMSRGERRVAAAARGGHEVSEAAAPASSLRPALPIAPRPPADPRRGRAALEAGVGGPQEPTGASAEPLASPIVREAAGPALRRRAAGDPVGVRRTRAASPAPSEPPTIRVTIGRVEVRAAAPPSPVAERPVRPPKLSLEAYLAGRQGGAG